MPDIHHDVEAQLRRMRGREFSVFDIDEPFHDTIPRGDYRPGKRPWVPEPKRAQQTQQPARATQDTSKFRAINAPISPRSPSNRTSPSCPPEHPIAQAIVASTIKSVARRRFAKKPIELRDREFTVFAAVGKAMMCNEIHYKMKWGNSTIEKRCIIQRNDRPSFVRVEGKEYKIKQYSDAGRNDAGAELCDVEWCESWVPVSELGLCKGLISDYEQSQDAAVIGGSSNVRGSVESENMSIGRSLSTGQSDQDDVSMPDADLAHPRQPEVLRSVFYPEFDADYRPGLRTYIRHQNLRFDRMIIAWPEEFDKRHLLFRRDFVEKGMKFDLGRREKWSAAFAYLAGIEQLVPCDCCQKGLGPFIKCVVSAQFANGACANCGFRRANEKCNFHRMCTQDRRVAVLDDHAPMQNPPSSPSSASSIIVLDRAARSSSPLFDSRDVSPFSQASSPFDIIASRGPSPELGSPSFWRGAERRIVDLTQDDQTTRESLAPVAPTQLNTTQPPTKRPASIDIAELKNEDEEWQYVSFKHPRLADDHDVPSSEQDVKFANFRESAVCATWIPRDFVHRGCRPHEACKNETLKPKPDSDYVGEKDWRQRVYQGKRFEVGEATPEQIRYILGKCPCNFTQSFEDGWRRWQYHPQSSHWTKELFLSAIYTAPLNQAVAHFCPRIEIPTKDDHVIAID